jgi:glycosyltransferase involved in cell wall biosynthesis
MRVTIDASCLVINRYSGLSEVVHNLLLHLPNVSTHHEFTLFANYFRDRTMAGDVSYPGTINNFCRIPRRFTALWWKFGWPSIDFYLTQTDIYHSLHIQIPPTKMIKTILTVHDCRFLAFPNLYSQQEVENYKNQMAISLARADMVTTVSEFTRKEILNYFSFPEDRIRVIQNGFNSSWVGKNCGQENESTFIEMSNIPQACLLYIGSLDPRKNLQRLIEAIARCKKETPDFPDLAIAGISQQQWNNSSLAIRAKELSLTDHIHLCGVIEKSILRRLIRNAIALCYPSLYEGFGFPPLEAMSLGVPVLAGKRSSIPEVTGQAACLIDPLSIDEIAQGLGRLVFDSSFRQRLSELGYEQVKKFSWRKAAYEYTDLYKEVLNS